VQHNEEYVLGVLQDGGLLTRKQIDSALSRLNGEPGVLDVLINDGALSEADVSRTLAAQVHMDWIDISTMIIPPQVIDSLGFLLQRELELVCTSPKTIREALIKYYGTADEAERFNAISRSRSAQVMHRNRQIRDSAI